MSHLRFSRDRSDDSDDDEFTFGVCSKALDEIVSVFVAGSGEGFLISGGGVDSVNLLQQYPRL